MATRRTLPVLLALLAIAGCGGESEQPVTTRASLDPEPAVAAPATSPAEIANAVKGATPMAERVATIGLLNKRNNLSKDLEIKPGESVEEGPVIIRVSACERTAPWEMPREAGAFVQVDILDRGQSGHRRVFSGWLFKESPSLNVVEHPIYDVWVKDCAMSFPGDE